MNLLLMWKKDSKETSQLGGYNNSEMYRILWKNENDDSKQTSLILKIALRNKIRRNISGTRALFLREISMYDKVWFIWSKIPHHCRLWQE